MDAAAALAGRGRPLSRPNPAVGAIIVKNGAVIGRGWTAEGGRPHAEAVALAQAGPAAQGATLHVTLEPCAHQSERGPSCTSLILKSGLARVVVGVQDPDPRTAGDGLAMLRGAGIDAQLMPSRSATRSLAGYLMRQRQGRPHVTLKLALSIDGCIAMADGQSQWITGAAARAHVHAERARTDAILVGSGTFRADAPRLDVRLPGLAAFSPARWMLSQSGTAPEGWQVLASPRDIAGLANVQYLFVEGGAQTAAAFLSADLIDRLLVYRAPILIGAGRASLGDIGLAALPDAHGRWHVVERRTLGSDTLEVYERARPATDCNT
ncbi:MAG: bifunctional diaminohydroxyphosphoribosylaminopyrimidine deaminase/5-amino-6-(5-phosphoribosylamino)uracil reductase RibD [Novosphingobium sp.]